MLENWTGEVVGRMHRSKITGLQLAERMGVTNAYLSTVLNGHKGSEETKRKVFAALESLEAEKNTVDADAANVTDAGPGDSK